MIGRYRDDESDCGCPGGTIMVSIVNESVNVFVVFNVMAIVVLIGQKLWSVSLCV